IPGIGYPDDAFIASLAPSGTSKELETRRAYTVLQATQSIARATTVPVDEFLSLIARAVVTAAEAIRLSEGDDQGVSYVDSISADVSWVLSHTSRVRLIDQELWI